MKWFQHMADAHDDEILRELLHRYGTDGIAVWWTTAELVAKSIKVVPDRKNSQGFRVLTQLEADPRVFADALAHKVPIDRLEIILKHCARRKRFYFKVTKDFWVVKWPKLVDFKDNATSDLVAKYGKLLGSSLEAASAGGSVPPISIDTSIREGGVGGEDNPDEMAVWFRRIMPAWTRMCPAPSERAQRSHIKDWIRQGVGRRAIEEAPMLPKYQRMDFYKIGEDLKGNINGNGSHANPGAKAVASFFGAGGNPREHAIPEGELGRKVEQRIADRRAKRKNASGALPAADGGGAEPRQSGGREEVEGAGGRTS